MTYEVRGNMARISHITDVPADYPYMGDPFERWLEWIYSELLVEHFAELCPKEKGGAHARLSEEDIIAQCYARTVSADMHYGTEKQLRWVFRRVANLLGWPCPKVCREHSE
jgi:hypothetical protein